MLSCLVKETIHSTLSFESSCTEVVLYFTAKRFRIQRKDENVKRNCNQNGLYQTALRAGVCVGTNCRLASDNKGH